MEPPHPLWSFVRFVERITRTLIKSALTAKNVVIVEGLRRKTMDESEIRIVVDKLIADNNLVAEIIDFENYEGDHTTVRVGVDRKDYERAIMVDGYFDGFSVSWRQKAPPLVAAEVGNFVLIFDEHHAQDGDSDVGLVSTKYVEESGDVYYGCRYIKIGLDNSFINHMYDFELTEENYGGFPTGFLKVLTAEEAQAHLSKQIEVAAKKDFEALQAKLERSTKGLPKLIAALGVVKKVKCDRIELDDDLPFSLSVKR